MRLPLLLLLTVLSLFSSTASHAAKKPAPPTRVVTELSDGWRFQFGDAPDAVKTAAFDDSKWDHVSVPHTWNRVGEYALTRSAATNNKQGIGWYRLSHDAKPMAKGRRMYIDFAAVGNIADVWVNGAHVGQHKGAFTRFRFDVTSQWKPGAKNLIVVRADNSKPAVGSSTEHVIPLAGDFFIHGGLYRGVQLIEANDVGIDLLDFGGPGVYVEPNWKERIPPSGQKDAKWIPGISVRVRASSPKANKMPITLHFKVRDREGRIVATHDTVREKSIGIQMSIFAGSYYLELPNAKTWDGMKNPYLYSVTAEMRNGGRLLDSVTVPFGIRDFKFDPNTGLTLNGKPLKLHGVSRHQDQLGKGWALSAKDHAEDMALMKEMGVNSVRHAHYPHADEWVEEADKAGMIVWAEVPYVTTPSLSGGEGSAEVFANAEQQTRELIRQNFNHPSIAMWAAGNEVDAGTLFGATDKVAKPRKLLDHINRIIKEEDPSRSTVFADCCEDVKMPVAGVGSIPEGEKLAGATDLIGYNRYYGWYYPRSAESRRAIGARDGQAPCQAPDAADIDFRVRRGRRVWPA